MQLKEQEVGLDQMLLKEEEGEGGLLLHQVTEEEGEGGLLLHQVTEEEGRTRQWQWVQHHSQQEEGVLGKGRSKERKVPCITCWWVMRQLMQLQGEIGCLT
jgi:hypothetical protein